MTARAAAGASRVVTPGEIAMALPVFAQSVNYGRVRVHPGSFFWFKLQRANTAMTPRGEMYFPPRHFREDFSAGTGADKHWFMHEMAHVWQHQLGYPVMLRGAIRIGLSYRYVLDDRRMLADYNMEAQGDILADYFALKFMRDAALVRNRIGTGGAQVYTLAAYERTLRDFTADPSSRRNLP